MQDPPLTVFEDFSQPARIVEATVAPYILPCTEFSDSPSNGRYSVITDENYNPIADEFGRYSYRSNLNYEVHWTEDEGFVFTDPASSLGIMAEIDGALTWAEDWKYPRNGSDYIFNAQAGPIVMPKQIICCDGVPAPSRSPTVPNITKHFKKVFDQAFDSRIFFSKI